MYLTAPLPFALKKSLGPRLRSLHAGMPPIFFFLFINLGHLYMLFTCYFMTVLKTYIVRTHPNPTHTHIH